MDVVPGHRVTVPFGRRSSYGFVVSLGTEEPGVETKPISTAGSEPLLLPHQVALARLVADHYWLPLIECIRAMLPPRVRGTGSAGVGGAAPPPPRRPPPPPPDRPPRPGPGGAPPRRQTPGPGGTPAPPP